MDEPFIAWWLVLLIGMWVCSVVVWKHTSLSHEIRSWAGVFAVFYLGLIFLALGFVPASFGSSLQQLNPQDFVLVSCAVVSLTAGIWILGPVSSHGRSIGYFVMTVSNAGFCWLIQGPETAIGLILVAAAVAAVVCRDWYHSQGCSPRQWMANAFRLNLPSIPTAKSSEPLLVGLLGFVVACVLIGALAYALRIETSRPTPSQRYSAIPDRALLDRIHHQVDLPKQESALLEILLGQRADVIVLIAAIVFLSLANTMVAPSIPTKRLTEPDSGMKPTDMIEKLA